MEVLDRATTPEDTASNERAGDSVTAIVSSAMLIHAVSAMLELGVVDHLEQGSGELTELASGLDVPAERLRVVLRAVTATGLLREPAPDRFELTPAARQLRGDDPSGLRDLFRMCTHGDFFRAWTKLTPAVRSDDSPFELHTGRGLFEYLTEHPEAAEIFHRAMRASAPAKVLADAVDLSDAGTVADLGGGEGATLAAVLRANPGAEGVLFDLPEVVAGAGPVLQAEGVADRCTVVGGNFLDTVPVRADVHLMVRVLQNWMPEDAVRILRNLRTAMPDSARLFVIGQLSDRARPDPMVEAVGLSMFVHYGAASRTAEECEELFSRADLTLHGVHRVRDGESVMEVRPG